jgi:putative ABC transport system permease protein
MQMWTLARRNLVRRPVRSGLTILGLAVGVAAVVALVGVAESLETSFLELYSDIDLVVQRRGGASQLAKGMDVTFGDKLKRIPRVQQVIGGLIDMVAFEDQDLFMVIANGWEVDCPVWDRIKILSGRRLHEGDLKAVMLGKILAANLGTTTGDRIQLYGQDFEVVGVFESFSIYENGAVFLLLDELQRQMDRPGEVTGFVVTTDDRRPDTIEAVRRQIETLDPDIAATPCGSFVSSLTQMRITRTMSWFTSVFAILLGAVGVMNTMAMSIFERRGEIGSLRAMGWRKSRVLKLILSESLYLSVLGAVVGVAVGILAITLLAHWRRTSGLVQGTISPRAVLEGVSVAIAIAIAGAIYPAYRCIKQPIADAMRSH